MWLATSDGYLEGNMHCPEVKRILVDLDQAIPDWAEPIFYLFLVAFRRRGRLLRLLRSLHLRRNSPARRSEKRNGKNYTAKKRDGAGLDSISHATFS